MATEPDAPEPSPTPRERVARVVKAPVATERRRRALLFAAAAGFASAAFLPWGAIAAAVVAYLAFEAGWER